MNKKWLNSLIKWLVVIAIPFILTLGTVRFVIAWDSPSYPEFEYGRIAPDQFGFTPEERLEFAEATLAYLRRPEPAEETIFLLEELRLPGTDESLYNEREIGHMFDVKVVADAFQRVFWILLIITAAGLIYLFARKGTRPLGAKALQHGGLITVLLVFMVMIFIGVAWGLAFTLFHNLFFSSGTWTFFYTDSLIRLFPEQFWFDFGLLWTGLILVQGLILALIGYLLGRTFKPGTNKR